MVNLLQPIAGADMPATPQLIAEYTNARKGHLAILTINRLVAGRREFVLNRAVEGKRAARAEAAALGAQPWNF